MTSSLNEALSVVAEEVFETLAFVMVMGEEEVGDSDDSFDVVRVGFEGPSCGTLYMRLPAEAVSEFANNMLGIDGDDEELSADDRNDALKEVANVTCGNLLPAIFNPEAFFKLLPPEIVPGDRIPECHNQLPRAANASLETDVGIIELAVFFAAEETSGAQPVEPVAVVSS